MRIISGKFRSKQIKPPKAFKGRPTTDFAKEGLFNIIQNRLDFEESSLLDLFSGTGAISYEFFSRGTEDIIAVDSSPVHVRYINSVMKELEMKNARAIKSDGFKFMVNCGRNFDVIFADPPYDLRDLDTIPDLIFRYELLSPSGFFILEHGQEHEFSNHPNFEKMKKYGHVHFSFFSNLDEEE